MVVLIVSDGCVYSLKHNVERGNAQRMAINLCFIFGTTLARGHACAALQDLSVLYVLYHSYNAGRRRRTSLVTT